MLVKVFVDGMHSERFGSYFRAIRTFKPVSTSPQLQTPMQWRRWLQSSSDSTNLISTASLSTALITYLTVKNESTSGSRGRSRSNKKTSSNSKFPNPKPPNGFSRGAQRKASPSSSSSRTALRRGLQRLRAGLRFEDPVWLLLARDQEVLSSYRVRM